MGARLAARGFEWGWQAHWMALRLEDLRSEYAASSGVRISVEDGSNWSATDVPYWNEDFAAVSRSLAREQKRRLWRFVAWLDDRPAGHSTVFVTTGPTGVAGIYNVGVAEWARRRGVGRAVTWAACAAARHCGCYWAMLNSATDIYEALGFRSLGRGQTWWMHSKALESAPDAVEVAFAEAVGLDDIAALTAIPWRPDDLEAPLSSGMRPVQLAVKAGAQRSVRWLAAQGATLHLLDLWDLGWRAEARV